MKQICNMSHPDGELDLLGEPLKNCPSIVSCFSCLSWFKHTEPRISNNELIRISYIHL